MINLNMTTSLPSYLNQIECWKINVYNEAELEVRADEKQHSLACKSLATDLAGKRRFLCVDMHMPFQVFHAREDPLTESALDFSAIIWRGD